jgi:adenylate cyclase
MRKIARLLSVRNVLEGSVRKSADRVRIEVELVDALNGFTVWSERYDEKLADVFQIQSDVAESVAENLKVKLLAGEKTLIDAKPTQNLEAYNLFLLGKYQVGQWTEASIAKGIDDFNRAIEKEPNFALAYSQMAFAYQIAADWSLPPREAAAKGKAVAERALAIDPNLGEAHAALAFALVPDRDWAAVRREFERAVALDPNDAATHGGYGWFLTPMGTQAEALAHLQRARELDPLAPQNLTEIGDAYTIWRQYDRALEYYQQAIDMAPEFWAGYLGRGYLGVYQGKIAEALADSEKVVALADFPANEGHLGAIYGRSGRRADALKILDHLKRLSASRYVTPVAFEAVYAGLGDKNEAFLWLDKADEERSNYLLWLKMPGFDPIRSDPRFQALYKKIGLPP